MTGLKVIILGALLFLALWLAYKIGKVILRLAIGLAFLGLIAAAVWYFFFR